MKFIEIDKKRYAVSFNMAALLEAQETLDISIEQLLTQFDTLKESQLMKLYYLALKFGADEAGRPLHITYSAFTAAMYADEEALQKLVDIVVKDIVDTVTVIAERAKSYNVPQSDDDDEPAKKKKRSGRTTAA